MKIEILLVDNLHERETGMDCFYIPDYMMKKISECNHVRGIVIIDGTTVKFSFSPYFMDGDIYTDHPEHKSLIKTLVPTYVYMNYAKFSKDQAGE